jgi:zinc protease
MKLWQRCFALFLLLTSVLAAVLAAVPMLAAQGVNPASQSGQSAAQDVTGASHTKPDAPPASPQTQAHPRQGIPSTWKQVPIPPLRPFQPQEARRLQLPNGLVIFLQEDHELPMINGVVRIRGGSRDEPGDKTGLTEIYGEVWRTGGTKSKTGDLLDDFLESRAALVETTSSLDSTFLSWSSLRKDFDSVFPVIVDLLENPEFRGGKIELAKKEITSLISRRNDDVDEIAHRESNKLTYGADSPYARTPEYSTIAAVSREDLLAWHARTVVASNLMVGVSGDFDSAVMERKLLEAFGGLPRGEPFVTAKVEFHDPLPGIYLIEKSDVNQSNISMVALGTDRHNPDYYAIEVMNVLFGGGFSSRLFSSIRSKQGLAYAVGGSVGTGFDHPGAVHISVGTRSGATVKAIDALNHEINRLIKGHVTQTELKKAKDAILNSFIFEFDSKDKVMAERMRYEFYGYPTDWLRRYRAAIEKVTAADVDRVARKYIHPEKLAVLVVGHAKDFDRDLASLGKVTVIDIAIPPAKEATGK